MLEDAFGIVAMVAMTPLIAIQVMGLVSEIKRKKQLAAARSEILALEDNMITYYAYKKAKEYFKEYWTCE